MVDSLQDLIQKAARIIVKSKNLIALTGAGMSAESGIPTFRGENGLWSKYRPEELATPEAFFRNPRFVWEWYAWRIGLVINAKPNPAHKALAELEKMGFLKLTITQNVDNLHERAGTKRLVKLHGDILTARCVSCGYKLHMSEPPKEIPPKCPSCGDIMRPDVVWFGEPLPVKALEKAFEYARRADAIIVVGTSGVVYPAGIIPHVVKNSGGTVIEVNIAESGITEIADIFLKGAAGKVLPELVLEVKRISERT